MLTRISVINGAVTPPTAKLMVSGVVGADGVPLGPSELWASGASPGNVVAASEVAAIVTHASVTNARVSSPESRSLIPKGDVNLSNWLPMA